MLISKEISFRKLEEKDLKLMFKWLNTDFVIKWYGQGGSTFDVVQKKYLPRIKGEKPVIPYMIVCDNMDIGYIQMYKIFDFPEYSQKINIDDPAVGIDLFIGEQDFIHKGLGKQIITKFLSEYAFPLSGIDCCIIGPEIKNKVAICAYEKAGFTYVKTIQVTDKDEPEYLMKLYRSELVEE